MREPRFDLRAGLRLIRGAKNLAIGGAGGEAITTRKNSQRAKRLQAGGEGLEGILRLVAAAARGAGQAQLQVIQMAGELLYGFEGTAEDAALRKCVQPQASFIQPGLGQRGQAALGGLKRGVDFFG